MTGAVLVVQKKILTGQRTFIKNLDYTYWGYVIPPRLRLILVGHDNYLATFGNEVLGSERRCGRSRRKNIMNNL